jgi:hypothetical protein
MVDILIMLIAIHFIVDFACQPNWMASFKGENWEIMFYHVAVYTSLFALFDVAIPGLIIIFITHFIIDNMKARWKIIKAIWVDQLLHIGVLFGIALLGLV